MAEQLDAMTPTERDWEDRRRAAELSFISGSTPKRGPERCLTIIASGWPSRLRKEMRFLPNIVAAARLSFGVLWHC